MEKNLEILRCYICDEEIHNDGKDIFGDKTDYSHISMHDLLEKLTGQEIKSFAGNKCWGCSSCIEKINEYDLACVTADRVQKELTYLLQQTTEKYYQNIEVINSPKEEVIDIGEHVVLENEVTYVVKDVAERYDESLEEEGNQYEVQFFTVDVENADNNEESKTEADEQDEYIDYEEVSKSANLIEEIPEVTTNEIEPSSYKKRTAKPKKNTFCKICRLDFSSFKELTEHRNEKHDNGERLVCDICGVRYKTRAALNIHIDLHNGISPFRCEICGKNFTQKGALKRHRAIHTGERPYQCEKCGKQFTHYSSFHMHNLAHDDIRNKKCEICGLLLRSSSHLNRHMLVHTGQKPHACPKCGQRFAQRYNMMSHLRSHQGIHRRKKFSCNMCNKNFTKENLLQEHIVEKMCKPAESINIYQIISGQEERRVVAHSDSSS